MNVEPVTGICPECSGTHIVQDYQRAEIVCEDCGLVLEDNIIDSGPEWREFEDSENKGRTGPSTSFLLHDRGLTTEISWPNKDAFGKPVPHKLRPQLYRIRKWHRRARMKMSERGLVAGLAQVSSLTSRMDLSYSVKQSAALLYRKAIEKNMIRGRSTEVVAAACVYAACRQAGLPKTLEDVTENSPSDRKLIGRVHRLLIRELGVRVELQSPDDYLARFCNELDLGNEVLEECRRIADVIREKMKTSGTSPIAVAAAIIYVACLRTNEQRTQREISDVTGRTEVTIRNRYKEILKILQEEGGS